MDNNNITIIFKTVFRKFYLSIDRSTAASDSIPFKELVSLFNQQSLVCSRFVKFSIDGKPVDEDDTIFNLNLKNGSLIDVHPLNQIKKINKTKKFRKAASDIGPKIEKIECPKLPPRYSRSRNDTSSVSKKVLSLKKLGFSEKDCIAALDAVGQNLDHAIDYILNKRENNSGSSAIVKKQKEQNYRQTMSCPNGSIQNSLINLKSEYMLDDLTIMQVLMINNYNEAETKKVLSTMI